MSLTSRIAVPGGALVATGALVGGLLIAPGSASADQRCTAWASMPSTVALAGRPVTIRMTLLGTAGCQAGGFDNGATATFRGPGAGDPQRWPSFGSTETETLQLRVNRLGRYTVEAGDVQVYDSNDERVPSTWRPTSVMVTRAVRVVDLHRAGTAVAGGLQVYSDTGWQQQPGARVVLEKKVDGQWRAVVGEKASRSGRFEFTGLQRRAQYRVVSGCAVQRV